MSAEVQLAIGDAIQQTYHKDHICGTEESFLQLSFGKDLDKAIRDLVLSVFAKGDTKSARKLLTKATAKTIVSGISEGFGKQVAKVDYTTKDEQMLEKLTRNTWRFSAAKTVEIEKAMSRALVDEKGVLREFSAFKKVAEGIAEVFNGAYLKTEYNHAVSSSQMAAQWLRYQESGATFLRYNTVGDDRVRDEHVLLDRIMKSIDDKFWDTWYPPNGWGCRCDVSEEFSGKATPDGKIRLPEVKKGFGGNVGKTGKAFSAGLFTLSKSELKQSNQLADDLRKE